MGWCWQRWIYQCVCKLCIGMRRRLRRCRWRGWCWQWRMPIHGKEEEIEVVQVDGVVFAAVDMPIHGKEEEIEAMGEVARRQASQAEREEREKREER